MNRRWRPTDILAVLLAASVLASVLASDDEQPLYVIHDGQRIPTVIIPPTNNERAAQEASLEMVTLDPETQTEQLDRPRDLHDRPGIIDEPEWGIPLALRYGAGQYAGYPVSHCRRRADRWWRYDPYLRPGYRRNLEEAYRAGRYIFERERGRRFNQRDMKRRKARVLNSHEKALRLGLERIKSDKYTQAVVALTMAADLNQGDPACRIHLAQARLAQGHYEAAGRVLHRALQLQPKLVYVSLNLPSYYSAPEEFDRHVDALNSWVAGHRAGAYTYFLLGCMEFQRDNFDQAYAAFRIAIRGLPKDSLTQDYLEITKPPAR